MKKSAVSILLLLFIAFHGDAYAQNKQKSKAKSSSPGLKESFRNIGHGFRDGARAIGRGTKAGVKAAKKSDKEQ